MAVIPFPNIQIPRDPNDQNGTVLNRIAQALTATFGSLNNVVTNDALVGDSPRFVGGPSRVPIGTGDTKVFHGLGHTVKTWDVVDINGPGIVYQSASHNASPQSYIILVASVPVSVLLRFT